MKNLKQQLKDRIVYKGTLPSDSPLTITEEVIDGTSRDVVHKFYVEVGSYVKYREGDGIDETRAKTNAVSMLTEELYGDLYRSLVNWFYKSGVDYCSCPKERKEFFDIVEDIKP